MKGKASTESGEPSSWCRARNVAKCWFELGAPGRQETRGGTIVSRRTVRGQGVAYMMENADLGQLCPGADMRSWFSKPKGAGEVSERSGWSA